MRLGIIGARSVPGRYGGFDTFATELAPRLVERGHQVTVYCQTRYAAANRPRQFLGVDLVYRQAVPRRSLETVSHEATSLAHALAHRQDAVFVLGTRASLIYASAAALKRPVFFNTDGWDWKRRKWGSIARGYLRLSERTAVRLSPRRLVADSRAIAQYLHDAYGVEPTYIPYGATVVNTASTANLKKWGLRPRGYFLVVARLEPENNIDIVIDAFASLDTGKQLVVVGGTNYPSKFMNELRRHASKQVLFTGGVYDPNDLNSLYFHAFAYVHGHEVGGTNPALLQAMGSGCFVLAHDVVFNREVLGSAGIYWKRSPKSLVNQLERALEDRDLVDHGRQQAVERIQREYQWDDVADRYSTYFMSRLGSDNYRPER